MPKDPRFALLVSRLRDTGFGLGIEPYEAFLPERTNAAGVRFCSNVIAGCRNQLHGGEDGALFGMWYPLCGHCTKAAVRADLIVCGAEEARRILRQRVKARQAEERERREALARADRECVEDTRALCVIGVAVQLARDATFDRLVAYFKGLEAHEVWAPYPNGECGVAHCFCSGQARWVVLRFGRVYRSVGLCPMAGTAYRRAGGKARAFDLKADADREAGEFTCRPPDRRKTPGSGVPLAA